MKKILLPVIALFCFIQIIIYFSACSDDNVSPTPQEPVHINAAYILSSGADYHLLNLSYLSYYNISNDSYNSNIASGTGLAHYPISMALTTHYVYIAGTSGYLNVFNINGSFAGSTTIDFPVSTMTVFGGKLFVAAYYTFGGTFESRDAESLNYIKRININGASRDMVGFGNNIYLLTAYQNQSDPDNALYVINPQTLDILSKTNLAPSPNSINITNESKLIIGCAGETGKIFLIDPVSYQKIDSFALQGGFQGCLSVDKQSNDVYYISYDNNIVKLNLDNRTTTIQINNLHPESSSFSGYNYDSDNKKHYVVDSKLGYALGKLYIYNQNSGLEKTFDTGTMPFKIIFFKN